MKRNAVISLNKWCEQGGFAPITAWRWRRKGWLRTINIAGRVYVTDEAIEEFTKRAERGEFSQKHSVPLPTRAAA